MVSTEAEYAVVRWSFGGKPHKHRQGVMAAQRQ